MFPLCKLSVRLVSFSEFCRYCELCKHRFSFQPSKSYHKAVLIFGMQQFLWDCLSSVRSIGHYTSVAVYSADMPAWLPPAELVAGILRTLRSLLKQWLDYTVVLAVWVFCVPMLTGEYNP